MCASSLVLPTFTKSRFTQIETDSLETWGDYVGVCIKNPTAVLTLLCVQVSSFYQLLWSRDSRKSKPILFKLGDIIYEYLLHKSGKFYGRSASRSRLTMRPSSLIVQTFTNSRFTQIETYSLETWDNYVPMTIYCTNLQGFKKTPPAVLALLCVQGRSIYQLLRSRDSC
jgi:hypothetical protein